MVADRQPRGFGPATGDTTAPPPRLLSLAQRKKKRSASMDTASASGSRSTFAPEQQRLGGRRIRHGSAIEDGSDASDHERRDRGVRRRSMRTYEELRLQHAQHQAHRHHTVDENIQHSSSTYAGGISRLSSAPDETSDESSTDTEARRFSWDIPRRDADRRRSWPRAKLPENPSGSSLPGGTSSTTSATTTASLKSSYDFATRSLFEGLSGRVSPVLHLQTRSGKLGAMSSSSVGHQHAGDAHHSQASPALRGRGLGPWIELITTTGTSFSIALSLARSGNEALRGSALQLVLITSAASIAFPLLSSSSVGIWQTEPRHYRDVPDQGYIVAMLFGPMLAAACLGEAFAAENSARASLPGESEWVVYPPEQGSRYPGLGPLSTARKALLSTQSVIFAITTIHLLGTRFSERGRPLPNQSAWFRLRSYCAFSVGVTLSLAAAHCAFRASSIGLWGSES